MILKKIEKINQVLMNFFNYFLCSIAYGFGVSLSFILFKLKKKRKKTNTYWIIPKEEEENYERQY
jgi:hypothetical protein